MATGNIKITKIAPGWVETLEEVFKELNKKYKPENSHEELLKAYMEEMEDQLHLMVAKRQMTYQLVFKPLEAMAFRQVFEIMETDNEYIAIIMQNIAHKIHKQQENQKAIHGKATK